MQLCPESNQDTKHSPHKKKKKKLKNFQCKDSRTKDNIEEAGTHYIMVHNMTLRRKELNHLYNQDFSDNLALLCRSPIQNMTLRRKELNHLYNQDFSDNLALLHRSS